MAVAFLSQKSCFHTERKKPALISEGACKPHFNPSYLFRGNSFSSRQFRKLVQVLSCCSIYCARFCHCRVIYVHMPYRRDKALAYNPAVSMRVSSEGRSAWRCRETCQPTEARRGNGMFSDLCVYVHETAQNTMVHCSARRGVIPPRRCLLWRATRSRLSLSAW